MDRREFGRGLAGVALASALPSARGEAAPATRTAGPKFSCMLWTLERQESFAQCLETVARAGYQGVELVGEFQKWTPEQTAERLRRMRSLGLVIDAMSGVQAGFAVPEEREAFAAQLREELRAAKELACPQIILLSGKRVAGLEAQAQFRTAVENLKMAGELAAAQGVEIVIEPIDPLENPTIFLTSVSDAFRMVREVNRPNVLMLYDFYHEQRAAGNLIEKLRENIASVGLVHIADVPGRHEPGTGEIDYANIYRALAELGYGRFIAMEFYPTGDAVTALRQARESAQRVFAATRQQQGGAAGSGPKQSRSAASA